MTLRTDFNINITWIIGDLFKGVWKVGQLGKLTWEVKRELGSEVWEAGVGR